MGTSSIGIVNKALVNSYDAKNRLSKVAIANANTAQTTAAASANTVSYRINALGQRVQKIGAGTFAQPTAIPFVITLSNPPTQAQLQTLNSSTTALYANSRFVYDEQGRLLGEYSKDGKLIQEIVWFDDLPVAILKPKGANATNPMSGTGNVAANNQDANNTGANGNTAPPAAPTAKVNVEVFYVHPDHLGTPRAVTASSALNATTGTGITSPQTVNKAVWRWDSDPFGSNATANSAPNENPNTLSQVVGTATMPYLFGFDLAFPGQKRDRETGKHYNYFRDYDPAIGRFPQSDPIGLNGGVSTFGYVDASPIRNIDPLGLMSFGGGVQPGPRHPALPALPYSRPANCFRTGECKCVTPECAAGLPPTRGEYRTNSEIDQGVCEMYCGWLWPGPLLPGATIVSWIKWGAGQGTSMWGCAKVCKKKEPNKCAPTSGSGFWDTMGYLYGWSPLE